MELYRNTFAEIDLNALKHNLVNIMDEANAKGEMILCVKADAYGHGAAETAKAALETGVLGFAVELTEEGADLRRNGIDSKIIVMGRANPKQIELSVKYDLEQCAADSEDIDAAYEFVNKYNKDAYIHLKIDTGMGRIGINDIAQLRTVLNTFKKYKDEKNKVVLKGIFTHFARADERNKDFTKEQFKKFNDYISVVKDEGFEPEIHCSNSAAGISLPEFKNNYFRCGIAAYGYHPSSDYKDIKPGLKPVMNVYAEISQIKEVPKNFPVGYNSTYYTNKPSRIATIQIGYADGFNRLLSNKGKVIVKTDTGFAYAPVIGRICMDQAMIDITDIPGLKKGDLVLVMGNAGSLTNNADDMAALCDTISYEILTSYSKRVPRIYI